MRAMLYRKTMALAFVMRLEQATDASGRNVAAPFRQRPPASDTVYYAKVKKAMDLDTIRERVERGTYKNFGTLARDVELVVDNALQHYASDTQEHADALALRRFFRPALYEQINECAAQREAQTPSPSAAAAAKRPAASPTASTPLGGSKKREFPFPRHGCKKGKARQKRD